MVGGLIAANSSTILTHLNWGASYLVHDFYRRFVRRDATERHYVAVGRFVTIGLFLASSGTVYLMDTARDAFGLILQIGAGTGLLYLVRWFWWRVNAWCEIVAMTSSLLVSVGLLVLAKTGTHLSGHAGLLLTVAITSVCWITTAFVGPETDRETLASFYRRVKPFGPGWARVRRDIGATADEATTAGENIPRALLGWFAGCASIWSGLFTIGNYLYGRWPQTGILAAVFLASTLTLAWVLKGLWPDTGEQTYPT
jgi:hypothetical protein